MDTPFDEDFCETLACRLGDALLQRDDDALRGFWCDGVSPLAYPESQLKKKSVNDTRQIVTKAWLGKTGQDEYELTIRFGPRSLSRYARGTSLIDCIPEADEKDWWRIDVEGRRIEVMLK